MRLPLTATLIVICTLCACKGKPNTESARSLPGQIANALNSGSADNLGAALAQDAVLIRDNGPALAGSGAVTGAYAKAFQQVGYKVSLSSEQMEAADDLIIDRGRFEGTLHTVDGKVSLPVEGNYLHVLKREWNGDWRVWRGAWTFGNAAATSCSDTGARSCCCKDIGGNDCIARPNEGCSSTYPVPILLP